MNLVLIKTVSKCHMHLNISFLSYHTDELINLLNKLNTNFKVIGITEKRLIQGFKNQQSWYTFFCAPNNTFAYMIVDLTSLAPQIIVHVHVYTNVYLAMDLLQSYEYFRVEGKLSSNLIHLYLVRDRRSCSSLTLLPQIFLYTSGEKKLNFLHDRQIYFDECI